MTKCKVAAIHWLRVDRRGVALIEFAITLPVLLALILVGMEFTNFVLAQYRVRAVAAMTADNASRLRSQMSEAFINELFLGVEKSGAGIHFADRGRVILSSVQNNNTGTGQWIRWQRCFGSLPLVSKYGSEGHGKDDSSLPDIAGLTAQPGSAIMYVEAEYKYRPLIPSSYLSNQRIRQEIAFVVRQRTDFSITGTNPSTC